MLTLNQAVSERHWSAANRSHLIVGWVRLKNLQRLVFISLQYPKMTFSVKGHIPEVATEEQFLSEGQGYRQFIGWLADIFIYQKQLEPKMINLTVSLSSISGKRALVPRIKICNYVNIFLWMYGQVDGYEYWCLSERVCVRKRVYTSVCADIWMWVHAILWRTHQSHRTFNIPFTMIGGRTKPDSKRTHTHTHTHTPSFQTGQNISSQNN